MFNVMVTAGDNAWEEGAYVWDRSRMLENTDDAIREPLKDLTEVCALVPPGVERPSDYDGIVYVPYDDAEGWQRKLVTELHAANVPVSQTWWQVPT